jgi:hypothetical protein
VFAQELRWKQTTVQPVQRYLLQMFMACSLLS